jgi:hypothetical protein
MDRCFTFLGLLAFAVGVAAAFSHVRPVEALPAPEPEPEVEPQAAPVCVAAYPFHAAFSLN